MNEEKIIDCSLCMFCSRTISHKDNEYFCGLPRSNPNDFYGKVIADQKQWKTQYDGMKLNATDMYVRNVRECSSFYLKDSIRGLNITDVAMTPLQISDYVNYRMKGKMPWYPLSNQFIFRDDGAFEVQPAPIEDCPTIKLKSKPLETFLMSIFFFLFAFMYAGIIFYLATSYDPESFIHIFGIFVSTIGFLTFITLFIKSFKKSKR